MRIAAIALAHNGILVTRNQKDFELVPGLTITSGTLRERRLVFGVDRSPNPQPKPNRLSKLLHVEACAPSSAVAYRHQGKSNLNLKIHT